MEKTKLCHLLLRLERSSEKENALYLKGGPKYSTSCSVYFLQERKEAQKAQRKEGINFLAGMGEITRHFPFTGPY